MNLHGAQLAAVALSPLTPALSGTAAAHEPSGAVTLLFTLLLVGMILCLAFEHQLHAKKSIIVGAFAVVSLFLAAVCGILPSGDVTVAGHVIHMPPYIPAVDWEVLAILVGASLFVDVASKSGIFTYVAIKVTKASGGDPVRLLWYYSLLTVLFSALLNNVTAMIIIGSLTAVSLDRLRKKELLLGFLLTEGLLTNVGGLLTLISSVPNIIVGNIAGIPFLQFFVVAAPYVVLATLATVMMAKGMFGIQGLPDEASRAAAVEMVAGFDENDQVESPGFFKFSAISLVLLIGFLASASFLPWICDLGMGWVTLAFAAMMLMLYRHEVDKFYAQLDWDLMAFFGGLFVVVNMAEHAAVLETMGHFLEKLVALGPEAGPQSLMWAAATASAVTDNVPLAAVLAKILSGMKAHAASVGQAFDPKLWWAVIFGANMGGNLTPIGSASTVVAVTLMTRHGCGLSFGAFVARAAPFALVQLAIASAYLWLILPHLQ